MNIKFIPATLAALALFLVVPAPCLTAQSTWQTPGGTWSDASNWLGGGVPNAPGDIAIFNALAVPGDKTVTISGSITLGSLLISGQQGTETATNLAFNGGLIAFDSGGASSAIWRVENNHHVTVSSTIALASNLGVFLADPADGYPSTLTLNGPVDLGAHTLDISTLFQTATAAITGAITGAGGSVVKNGVGVLRLDSTSNTFNGGLLLNGGRTETTLAGGAGGGITLGALAAGQNNLGIGDIALTGNAAVLQILTSAANQTVQLSGHALTLAGNSRVDILKDATSHTGGAFILNGGTLSGGATPAASGTLRLGGLDLAYLSGTILNAPNLLLESGPGATATSIQRINGNGSAAAITGLGDITKTGPGSLVIGSDITLLSAQNLLFRSGTLALGATADLALSGTLALGITGTGALTQEVILGKSGQFDTVASIAVLDGYQTAFDTYYNVATLRLNSTDQTLRNITVGNLAALLMDMGAPGSASTLTLAGANTGDINILNWEGNPDGLLGGTAVRDDILRLTGGVNPSDVWVYGFEKGVTAIGGGLYKPTTFMTGTWTGAANNNYFDYRNWGSGANIAGMEIPNHPGAIVRVDRAPGNANINITGTVTVGQWLINESYNGGGPSGGTVIWDTGVSGSAAAIIQTTTSPSTHLDRTMGAFVLKSDLIWDVGRASSMMRGIAGTISGSGALIVRGYGHLTNASSYTGGTVLESTGWLGIMGTANTDLHALGSGTLTILGGRIMGGGNSTDRATTIVTNPLAIEGNFTASYITFGYGGDVVLTGTRTITVNEAAQNISYGRSVTFSATTNLVGSGGLAKAGTMGALYLNSGGNTFEGGLFLNSGYLYTEVRSGGLVIGALAPGQNYLGSGSINISGGATLWNSLGGNFAELRGTVVVNNGYLGFYSNGTVTLQNTGTLVTQGGGGGLTFQNAITLINNGVTLAGAPNLTFSTTGSSAITGQALTGISTLSKSNIGDLWLSTTVSANALSISGGQLILNQSGNGFGTVNLAGGQLRAGTTTANTLGVLRLTGNAGIYMEKDSVLTFSSLSGTSPSDWTPAMQLNLANDDNDWNYTGHLGVTNNYIYIGNITAGNAGNYAAQLDRIAFAGRAPGAIFLADASGTKYYLAPTGAAIDEWSGNIGDDYTGATWNSATNWASGHVPNAPGAYAGIRDIDQKLDGKTITVDGAFKVGTLEVSSNNARIILSGGTLAFDNGGSPAHLNTSNGNLLTINSTLLLEDDLLIENFNHYDSYSRTALNGRITGDGGIAYTGYASSAYGLILGTTEAGGTSTSDFAGGFRFIGSAATAALASNMPVIRIGANGTLFGTGTLTIGDGTPGLWYGLRPGSQGSNDVTGVTRDVTVGALEIKGNIFFGQTLENNASSLWLRSPGTGFIASGTWELNGNGANSGATHNGYSTLVFDLPLAGSGALKVAQKSNVRFLGDNSGWSGGLIAGAQFSNVYVGTDTALGTGKVTWQSGDAAMYVVGGTRTLSNQFQFTDYFKLYGGDLILDYVGTSTMTSFRPSIENNRTLTFTAGHHLAGTGNLTVGYNGYGQAGTLVLLGSNSYTGNTYLDVGTLAVGDDHAIGTGTLFVRNSNYVTTLASSARAVTLANPVNFTSTSYTEARFNGAAGLLTLAPALAQASTLNSFYTLTITGGTVAFGENLSFTGNGGLIKTGVGTLWLESNASDYTGNTQIVQGTLSAMAGSGNITLGKYVLGENYFGGGGHVTFVSGNYNRTLELVSTATVTLAGNMNLVGNSDAYRANVNVTGQSGTLAGSGVETRLNPDAVMTVAGNQYGWLNIAGNLIKTGAGSVGITGGNINVLGDEFHLAGGVVSWQGGQIFTKNLNITGGSLELYNVNSPGVEKLTLSNGMRLEVMPGYEATLSSALLDIGTGGGILDLNGGGVLTLGGAAGAWPGSLLVDNWAGELAGGGVTRLQFANAAPSGALLGSITFHDTRPGVQYLPGARATRNYLGLLELVPIGTGAEWSGSNNTNIWHVNQMLNWDPNSTPSAVDAVALFADLDPSLDGKTVELAQNVTLGGLVLSSNTADNYAISDGGNGYGLTFDRTAGAAFIQMTNKNSVVIDALISLNDALEITNADSGTLAFAKSITANGRAVSKEGGGMVVFDAANYFTAGFTLNAGTVRMGHDGALGTSQLTFNNGALDTGGVDRLLANNYALGGTLGLIGSATFSGNGAIRGGGLDIASASDTLTATGTLSGTGSLTKTGEGTLLLTNANTFTGGYTAAGGITGIANNAALGTGTLTLGGSGGTCVPPVSSGTVRLDADGLNLANNIIAGGGELNTGANSGTLSGVISGSRGFVKGGSGTLTLTASNAHTGTTAVRAGALVAAGAGALGRSLASLESLSSLVLTFTSGTMDNTLAGSGSLIVSGTVALSGSSGGYTGNSLVRSGVLTIAGDDALGTGTLTLNDATTLAYNDGITLSNAVNVLASGTFNVAGGTATQSGVISGANMVKTGAGNLTLTGNNPYTGTTTVNGGELQIGDGGTSGSILAMTDAGKTVNVDAGASLVFNRGDTIAYSGTIAGSGTVVQRGGGVLLFDGVEQKHTGGSVVESGTMKIANGGAVGTAATVGVTDVVDIREGAVFHLGENGGNYGLVNTLEGGGTLVVDLGETSHASGTYDFSFANTAVKAAQYGRDFHGAVEMRHAEYEINQTAEAFLNAGTSSLRTKDGSYGSLLANSGSARRIEGGVDFAGGVFQWNFDGANNPVAYLSSGTINISAATEFRLNLQNTLQANTSGTQTLASLFSTVVTGADSLLLGKSDMDILGAMNWANLKYSTNNGASWNNLTTPMRQGIGQNGAEVGKGVFDWTAYEATGTNSHDLRVGFALDQIEIFQARTLEVALGTGDSNNAFGIALTDYIHNAADGAAYSGSAGSGNVRYSDVSNTGTGIRLNAANSYTGTTFISGSTTLVVTNSEALGSGTRHTVMVSATQTGAVLNLGGNVTNVGGVQISNGGQINLNNGVLNIRDNTSGQPGVTATAAGGGTVSGNNALTGSGTLNLNFGHLTVSGTNANLHGTGSIANNATASLDSVSGLGDSALNVSGLLEWVGATGTNLNNISGTGIVSATSAANVILGGSNSAFSGTWTIAADSALKATGSTSLGAGKVNVSGTLITGARAFQPADWTLNTANTISGTGVLLKQDASTVTITHDSGTAGTLLVNGGTLAFTNNGKFTTTGSAVNDSALAMSGGAHLNVGTSYRQSAATLTVDTAGRNATDNYITAGTATIGGTLNVLNFASFNNSGSASGIVANNGLQYILSTTGGTISGTFATVTGVDQSAQDYLYGGGQIINSGSTYAVGYGLRWYAADDTINSGTFTIDGGSTFVIDALPTLSGQAGVGLVNVGGTQFGWDGKSLTKLGEGTLTLSATNTYTGTTLVREGVLNITGYVGGTAGVVDGGTATVSGGVWNTGALAVGVGGTGVLNLGNSGTLVTVGAAYLASPNYRVQIGQEAGSSGTVTLTGSSVWLNHYAADSRLTVGGFGDGGLSVSDGSRVETDRLNIGTGPGSTGLVTVSGSGSQILTQGSVVSKTTLTVGASGSGRLVIENGAEVRSAAASIGGFILNEQPYLGATPGEGTVLVTGSGSRLNVTGLQLTVGDGATGLLEITDGGAFTGTGNTAVYVGLIGWSGAQTSGSATSASGSISVSGEGSSFSTGGDIYIGMGHGYALPADPAAYTGSGALTVGNGAVISGSANLIVGNGTEGTGTVSVSDARLQLGDSVILGDDGGRGGMTVSGSGVVTAGGTYAQNAQSTLTLDVAGRGANDAFVYANTATVGGTLAVTSATGISGTYATASAVANSALQYLVTATGGVISGTFATITVNGTNNHAINAALPDYLYGGVYKTTTGTSYVIGTGLRWLADAANGSGTFTIGSGSTFMVDLALSDTMGAGSYASDWDGKTLTKAGDGLLLVTSSNTFSGGALVSGGTLELRNLHGAGSGTVGVSAAGILNLSGTGAYANHTTGGGTALVSGSVNLTGGNSINNWLVTGRGLVTSQTNLGNSGRVNLDGGNLTVSASTWTFINSLTGDGTLTVDLASGGTFNFATSATNTTAFSGTVDVKTGFFQLDNIAAGVAVSATSGTGIMKNATLSLGASGTTLADSGTYFLGGLAFEGGVLKINMADAVTTSGSLTAGDLSAPSASKVQLDNYNFVSQSTPGGQDFFYQDTGTVFATLVSATGSVNDAGAQLALQNFSGSAIGSVNGVSVSQNGGASGTAKYDYTGQVLDDGMHKGLYITYGLTELSANSGTFITVSNAGTQDADNRLTAKLTGSGGFVFNGTGAYEIGSAASDYSGSTHIASGAFVAYSNNATGSTSLLDNDATFDLNGKTQTVGALDNSGVLNFNNGTLTIRGTTGNSTSTGTLGGSGALIVQSSTLTVSGSNNTTVSGTINNGAAIVVNNVSGLGIGAITDNGAFIFAAATGTNANTFSGTGLVSATGAASVELGGANSAFSGTWSIAGDSNFKAITADSLGAGKVTDSGTLTLGGMTNYELQMTNEISGSGMLVKEDANTITISHSNAYTGNTLVNAGTLSLTAQNAIGTGTANVTGVLNLALTGTFANNTIGTGTAQLSGAGVAVTGTNSSFIGAWNVTGSGTMTAQQNLGASGTTKVNIASGGNLALMDMGGGYEFNQQLTGAGNLLVGNAGAFGFGTATGTAFTGTVQLQNNTFTLTGSNLVNATLNIDVNNKTTVATGTQNVGNLTLTSGTIAFTLDASGTAAAGIVNTGTLSMSGSTVVMVDTGSFGQSLPLLQQDESRDIQLIAATAHTGATQVSGSNLVDHNGNELTNATRRDIIQNSATTASGTYNFAATVSGSGLWLGYELVALELLASQTTVLNGDLTSPLGADELHALISGSGNLQISASNAIRLNNAGNSYTGTTFVTSGTLVSGTNNALGHTSWLAISNTAAYDLNGKTQAIGGGRIDGTLAGSGSLGIAGLATITSTNVNFTANVGVSGTTILANTDAIGRTGTACVATNAELQLAGATGTLSKPIDGTGIVSATNAANVILAGTNTFSGTWQIAAGSALKATGSASLGTGKVTDSGTLTLGGMTNYELQMTNEISGSGMLVKEDANTITISYSNAYTGNTLVNAGTLSLTAQNAIGTGTANVTSMLDLAFTGTFANNTIGTGTAQLSGAGVAVTGTNSSFTGAWNVTGSGTMTAQQNLGASGTTRVNIASGGNLALMGMGGGYEFNQQLTGAGNLLVGNAGAFGFGAATGTAFSGTVQLQNNTFTLTGSNLVNATLNIDTNNRTAVATGTQNVGNLTLTSGTIAFTLDASGMAAAGIVNTGTLSMSGSTVVMVDTGSFGQSLPLLQQDESHDIQLIAATAHTGATQVSGSNLVDQNGSQITDATQHGIVQSSATTALGTYDFAATVSGSGLHLGYELIALDLIAGQTTVLDHDIANAVLAGADELHALVSGSGNLQISASSAITINHGANSYTGTTFVTSGTLVTGNSGALGGTSLLAITSTATADLNATAQTVGALDNAGALLFNGGTLAISGSGGNSTSGGVLSGSGALVVQSNTLTITNANAGLSASTTIAAGATADLRHVAGLGSGAITGDGTLRLDIAPANSGTLANALSGSGVFIKASSGTVAITTANPGFNGSARVQGGRLLLEDLMALSAAGVDVNPGATLEYRNVSGTLANTVNGSGTLAITNSGTLAIAHDNAIANSVLENAKVYLGATQALGDAAARVRADNRSEIWFALDGARLGHVTLDGAKLGFIHAGTGLFKTGTVASLAGSNARLEFNVDFTNVSGTNAPAAVANHLAVTGSSAGAFTVSVNALGGEPSSDETAIPLITDLNGAAVYQLEGEKITLGLSEFEFANGAAADSTLPLNPGTWYLYSTGLSQAADAIIDTAALIGQDWHYSLDALYLRMGDVRAELLASASTSTFNLNSDASGIGGNVWVRSRGYRLNADNILTGRGVEQYAYGVTAGGDKAFATESGVNLLGAFIDMGRITRDFGRNSDGETGSASVGLYGTMLKTNGWHADLVLKADRYKHSFEVSTVNGRPVRGRYNSEAFGASLEVGRRLERADGWWVEPVAQAAVARLTGASYRTTPANVAIAVKVDDATAAQYRGQVRFGRQFRDTRWTPYGKFGVVRTDTGGGEITAHERRFDPAALGLDGWRVEFGFGTGYRLNDLSQLYFDYEYGRAAHYERPWSLNLGYRRLW
ncbi:autotransporter-associated beta strand repeat-containing protein [Termitidicoccus mucosus]|uniref:Autotransporter domain-containing protein n=1 Tax=Termitidicoccus mucosus TaxID=1184151 RepID=A0A178IGJ4_9BACT|nr:hypothetical protein AW736_14745 [Opitutaceae bacterium TSB47]